MEGLFVRNVALFDKSQVEEDKEFNCYSAPIFDVNNGYFWYNITTPEDIYNSVVVNMPMKPKHIVFAGYLQDVPLMADYAGTVNESRSEVQVPAGFVTGLIGTGVPYIFSKGPEEGYYLVNFKEPAKFHQIEEEEEGFTAHDIWQEEDDDDQVDDQKKRYKGKEKESIDVDTTSTLSGQAKELMSSQQPSTSSSITAKVKETASLGKMKEIISLPKTKQAIDKGKQKASLGKGKEKASLGKLKQKETSDIQYEQTARKGEATVTSKVSAATEAEMGKSRLKKSDQTSKKGQEAQILHSLLQKKVAATTATSAIVSKMVKTTDTTSESDVSSNADYESLLVSQLVRGDVEAESGQTEEEEEDDDDDDDDDLESLTTLKRARSSDTTATKWAKKKSKAVGGLKDFMEKLMTKK
ncbi:diphosphomevalonate decarboxylase [Mucor velutinosus]|uniref:Diphosphomevalonate decarboxylase n=1 Tax=Mucor velutinosus TaxID=708070 RepID=A0AAN7DP77_9FUNG|nr:diphosphomevalonate decarboxylase [Mucor velutinosus]